MGEQNDEARTQKCRHDCQVSSPLKDVLNEHAKNSGKAHGGHVGTSQNSGVIGRGRFTTTGASGAGSGGTVGGGRVVGVSLALVLAVNGVLLPGVEGAAAKVASGLHVEATTDVLEGRKSSPEE